MKKIDKFSLKEIEQAFKVGDKKMKERNGHRYMRILKTRCEYCGRSPKQKGRCPFWYQTLYTLAIEELLNKSTRKRASK